MALQKEDLKKLVEAQKKKTILTGVVKLSRDSKVNNKEELVVQTNGINCLCVIPSDEIDYEFPFRSLMTFIGATVHFVVKSIDAENEMFIGSRAEAQRVMAPEIISKLEDGECFDGKIINILPYGAYIDINGVVGLLKNVDFAEDYTTIKDLHNLGDKVKVKMRGRSKNGKILFEAVKKYVNPNSLKKEDLAPGQMIVGVVRNIQPWGIFVTILPNLDALADSEIPDIQEDQKVKMLIKSIKTDDDKFKVHGKIISLA
jgi:ribosomal protein S1